MFSEPKSLGLKASIAQHEAASQIQQIKSLGNQPRVGVLSPSVIADTGARAISTPGHVQNVRVRVEHVSDATSKVTVTFKRDPNDSFFSHALVHVSGYKGNPAPTQLASGQSPISFAMENTGEGVAVHVQSNGNLGPAPLVTAPTATMQLRSTPLANQITDSGTGITPAAITVIQASLNTPGRNVYPTFNTITGALSGGGRTGCSVFSGRQMINTADKWTFSVHCVGGGVVLGSLVVLKTLIDDLNVVGSAAYTFGGSATPTLGNGNSTSDPIVFTLDTAHDYWVMYVIDISSPGSINYGEVAPGGSTFLNALSLGYFWTTNVTGTTPINLGTAIKIGTQLNQVLTA